MATRSIDLAIDSEDRREDQVWKDLLRDIYHSEDLKIKGERSEQIKLTIHRLCTEAVDPDDLDSFLASFKVVKDNLQAIKDAHCKKNKEPPFQQMFQYQANTLSSVIGHLPSYLKDSIMWQMIVEQLFMVETPADKLNHHPPLVSESTLSEITVVEENAIYYSAGYVVKKLLQQYKTEKKNKENADIIVNALLNLLGDEHYNAESCNSYLDYVKVWTETTDRGGLKHVSEETFRFFRALELITYELLQKGATKMEVISKVVADDNVLFYWDFVMHEFLSVSTALLLDVVTLWFTIRGFAITSNLFEQYKKATSKNIKGKKGLRKDLQHTTKD